MFDMETAYASALTATFSACGWVFTHATTGDDHVAWVAHRDPELLAVTLIRFGNVVEAVIDLVAEGRPDPSSRRVVEASSPDDLARRTTAELRRHGWWELATVGADTALDVLLRRLVLPAVADLGVDRADLAVAELDGNHPWHALPPAAASLIDLLVDEPLTVAVAPHRYAALAGLSALRARGVTEDLDRCRTRLGQDWTDTLLSGFSVCTAPFEGSSLQTDPAR